MIGNLVTIKSLAERLEDYALIRDERVLVWLVGPPGVGKSYILQILNLHHANTWSYDKDKDNLPPNYEPYVLFIETHKEHIEQLTHCLYDKLITIKLNKPQQICLENLKKEIAIKDPKEQQDRISCLTADFLYSYPADKELFLETDIQVDRFLREVIALYLSYPVNN